MNGHRVILAGGSGFLGRSLTRASPRRDAACARTLLWNSWETDATQSKSMCKFGFHHLDFGFQFVYRYVFGEAALHTDGRVTRQTRPGALEWLAGYPVK